MQKIAKQIKKKKTPTRVKKFKTVQKKWQKMPHKKMPKTIKRIKHTRHTKCTNHTKSRLSDTFARPSDNWYVTPDNHDQPELNISKLMMIDG